MICMTQRCGWCDSWIFVTCLMTWPRDICDETHEYVWCDSWMFVIWLMTLLEGLGDVTRANMSHDLWHNVIHEHVWRHSCQDSEMLLRNLLGCGISTPYTLVCLICTVNSEPIFFPIFKPGSIFTGLSIHHSQCNILQQTATRCNTSICNIPWHATVHRNTLHHTARGGSNYEHPTPPCQCATPRKSPQRTATNCYILQHIATHRNTLQHTATYCDKYGGSSRHPMTPCQFATHRNTPLTAAHRNSLPHTATHCNARHRRQQL